MTPRDRRALWWGAVVIGPALLFIYAARPLATRFQALREEIVRERDLLAREQALLAEAPTLQATAAALETVMAAADQRQFPGPDPLGATTALAAYVGDVARRYRVHVEQGETRPATAAPGGLVAIEIALRGAGDLEGILGWLTALERGAPRVDVARLAIERTSGINAEPEREALAVALVLRGFTDETALPPAARPRAGIPEALPPSVRLAVQRAPFRSDRRPPSRRYAPPGTMAPIRVAALAARVALTGTVVYPDGGGLALVRVGGQSHAMVRVGETVGGLTLRSVAPEEAVFVQAGGGTVVLRVPKPET